MEKRMKDSKHERDSTLYCWLWRQRVMQGKEGRQLSEDDNYPHPQWQPAKKLGPQSYTCMELNSANNWNDTGSALSPRASRKEHNSADILILAL